MPDGLLGLVGWLAARTWTTDDAARKARTSERVSINEKSADKTPAINQEAQRHVCEINLHKSWAM